MPKATKTWYQTPKGKLYTVTKNNTKSYKTNRQPPKGVVIVPETAESKAALSRTSGTTGKRSKRKSTRSPTAAKAPSKPKKVKKKTTTAKSTKGNAMLAKERVGNRTYVTVGRDGEMLTFAQVMDALMSAADNDVKRALRTARGQLRTLHDESLHLHDEFLVQVSD